MKRVLYFIQSYPLETIFFVLFVLVDVIGVAQGVTFAQARNMGPEPPHFFFLAGEYPPLFCILACVINLPVFAIYVPFHLLLSLSGVFANDILLVLGGCFLGTTVIPTLMPAETSELRSSPFEFGKVLFKRIQALFDDR